MLYQSGAGLALAHGACGLGATKAVSSGLSALGPVPHLIASRMRSQLFTGVFALVILGVLQVLVVRTNQATAFCAHTSASASLRSQQ